MHNIPVRPFIELIVDKMDRVIKWFWVCLCSWSAERKARLLQFTTGMSHVPVNGFKDLQGSDGP
jgi:E3 ubiquitin-protein ligase NEDD4